VSTRDTGVFVLASVVTSSAAIMSVAEQASATGRMASLDVLRGVAILGTFASNAWLFDVPGGATVWPVGRLADARPWWVSGCGPRSARS
jgi:uncharacterized membrane protein YeiB